ncbi:MAG: IS30 family transposase [candidate division WWE3 bacterium]|nr:IS30 family transposase [candidate division WWE3 bacterium]
MPSYEHLNIEERERLFGWRESGVSLQEIGRRLGRNVSTVSRELERNTYFGRQYLPCLAQRRAERVGLKQRYQAPLKNPEVFLYVREHLRLPHLWSPEAIAGRIGIDIKGARINQETIYRYIYGRRGKKYKLWQYLECGRKKRMKKDGRRVHNKGKVPNAISIDLRPKAVNNRKVVGYWETDNIEGPRKSKSALSVISERSVRRVLISKIANQTAVVKTASLVQRMKIYPQALLGSITQDNGQENYCHQETGKALGTTMYFCNAYHSWEKGGVENRNKAIRRFFPKGTDFDLVSDEEVAVVEYIINSRPMKCLNYLKPYEKMQQLVSKLGST